MKKAMLLIGMLLAAPVSLSAQPPQGNPLAAKAAKSLQGTWELVTRTAAFSPRDTAEDLVFDGKMWISNGYYHGNKLTRDLWSSADGKTWTLVNPQTPYDGYSELVVFRNKMWAVKGSVWCSTDGVKWTQVLARTPFGARGYGEVVVHQDKMWQLGSGADVWHSADGVNWTCATKEAPYGRRSGAAVTVFEGRFWVMGGSVGRANTPPEKGYPQITTYNDVWSSSDGANWTRVLERAPWAPRKWFIAQVYAGRMWIIGGYDNVHHTNFGDVWHSADGITWQSLSVAGGFAPRHEPTCYVFDNSLWVVAGNTWPVRNDVWRLKLSESR